MAARQLLFLNQRVEDGEFEFEFEFGIAVEYEDGEKRGP